MELKGSQRYLALDVMRGLTVALMIVVNTPGDWGAIYAPFRHAEWHGFTLTDLVFPTFLFVVGNAMSFGMPRMAVLSHSEFLQKVLKRTALIFLIGLFLNAFPFVHAEDGKLVLNDLGAIRIWGVLQRIAVCYCFASLLIRFFRGRVLLLLSILLLVFYWVVMILFGTGDPFSLAGNAALKVDLLLLPAKNLYQGFGIPFDPEGLLSTIPAVVNVIAGYLAGKYIQQQQKQLSVVFRLISAGVILIGIAQVWNLYLPVNKPLWTSSYVLQTVGFDLVVLAVLVWIIDVRNSASWTYFFEVFGKNPLFIYALSGMLITILYLIPVNGDVLGSWIYNNIFLSWLHGKNASLAFAISYMLTLWLIGYVMDKKKIYVKV